MARDEYLVKHTYLGDGGNSEYDFDFKIQRTTDLLIIKVNDSGDEVWRIRGDDEVYLSDVTFDAIRDEGGTITLVDALETDYSLIILLAPDSPTQEILFREMGPFFLRAVERALDWLSGQIQRVAYLAQRSVKLHDLDDEDLIDMTLPPGFADYAGYAIGVNEDGDGVDFLEIPNDASPSTNPFGTQVAYDITEGDTDLELEDETVDKDVYKSVIYLYEITRGTTVFSMGQFSLHYRNGAWELVVWNENHSDDASDDGCEFDLTGTTTAQLTITVASDGKGNGELKLRKVAFDA